MVEGITRKKKVPFHSLSSQNINLITKYIYAVTQNRLFEFHT